LIDYTDKLIERLFSDLWQWNKWKTKKHLIKVSNSIATDFKHKLAALLVVKDYEEQKKELLSDLGDFVLLRNRIHTLSEALRKPELVLSIIENHQKRVQWQIRRIYRTRNLIIHSAKTPKYLPTLIENSHEYLDIFLDKTRSYACKDEKTFSIRQVAKIISLKMESRGKYLKELKKSKAQFSSENYVKILFGVEAGQS
jgi:hypothetical protein